ncbi:MAG: DUF1295 domain-containing protein [Clostridia bacterium]|nr:DUF1295 domain-containing protein [Clostridia bacterium]
MKINRLTSFIIIAAVYALATVLGVWVYFAISGAVWLRLLIADCVATVVTFVFSLIFRNASVYDPYWSVQPIIIVFAFLFAGGVTLPKILICVIIGLWGVRLTANWAYTFHGLAYQDWRYTSLKEKTGAFYPFVNFFGIHLVPTLIVYACTLPAIYVMQSLESFNPLCLIGLVISLFAVVLQATADIQMHKYRKNRTGNFIRTGVWKYSRHPNYLAEICMWWGIALFTVFQVGFEWYYLIGALLNTLLFLFVSIPLADGRQSKKEGFAEYKQQTRMLLPIKKHNGLGKKMERQ